MTGSAQNHLWHSYTAVTHIWVFFYVSVWFINLAAACHYSFSDYQNIFGYMSLRAGIKCNVLAVLCIFLLKNLIFGVFAKLHATYSFTATSMCMWLMMVILHDVMKVVTMLLGLRRHRSRWESGVWQQRVWVWRFPTRLYHRKKQRFLNPALHRGAVVVHHISFTAVCLIDKYSKLVNGL